MLGALSERSRTMGMRGCADPMKRLVYKVKMSDTH